MEKEKRIELYQKALSKWGVLAQQKMLMEEVGELFSAIGKFDRMRVEEKDVITELADVSIMVEQMATLFGYEAFEKEKEYKLNRLKERLEK
jgi:NTP pyrophosphatase (non-canonical NTP hydrolase)